MRSALGNLLQFFKMDATQHASPTGDTTPVGTTDIDIDSDKSMAEKPAQSIDKSEYPTGLRFVSLASASIVAVFLIALDQVRHLPRRTLF